MAQCEINNSSICFGIINAAVDWGIRTWGIRCADALKVNKLMHEEDKHQIAHILRPRGISQSLEAQGFYKRVELWQNLKKLLCLYDGIKLRSYDKEYIDWLKMPEQRKFFDLKPTYCYRGESELRLQGRYLNIDINITYQGKWVVDFSGSIHKLFNILIGEGAHNYNDFSWSDFLQVQDAMASIFGFNSEEIEVVNLEAGVNLTLPDWFKLSIAELIESIISLCGVCKNKQDNTKSNRLSYAVQKGDAYMKAYSKTAQHKLAVPVLRLEIGWTRARPLIKMGVKYFSDLNQPSAILKFKSQLLQTFRSLHTWHPDLKKVPIEVIEANRDILESKSSFWCRLKRENRYLYNKKRLEQDRLTALHCSFNPTNEILALLAEKLQ